MAVPAAVLVAKTSSLEEQQIIDRAFAAGDAGDLKALVSEVSNLIKCFKVCVSRKEDLTSKSYLTEPLFRLGTLFKDSPDHAEVIAEAFKTVLIYSSDTFLQEEAINHLEKIGPLLDVVHRIYMNRVILIHAPYETGSRQRAFREVVVDAPRLGPVRAQMNIDAARTFLAVSRPPHP